MMPILAPFPVLALTTLFSLAGVSPAGPPAATAPPTQPAAAASEIRPGEVVRRATPHGEYVVYIPEHRRPHGRILAIIHGTPKPDEQAVERAERFLRRWVQWAEERSCILIAPAFDQENFGSIVGPGGGYRGLFGRRIGADAFLHEIVDAYTHLTPAFGNRFSLYGHSAGAQFVGRYVVRHPDRVISAVLSAPGSLAFPDVRAPWPLGMAPRRRAVQWPGEGGRQEVNVEPATEAWIAAANRPIVVVVGSDDTEPQPRRSGQIGETRVEIARNWVQAMSTLARENGKRGRARFVLVNDIGHDSARLTAHCTRFVLLR